MTCWPRLLQSALLALNDLADGLKQEYVRLRMRCGFKEELICGSRMARVHAEGQAGHGVSFWLYNLPSNLFVLDERQMLAIAFLEQTSGPQMISSAFQWCMDIGLGLASSRNPSLCSFYNL